MTEVALPPLDQLSPVTATGVDDETDEERRRREVLGPLAKLVLNARLVSLFLVILAAPIATGEGILTLLLMTLTSVLPVLAWARIGGWVLRHPSALSIDLLVAGTLLIVVPDSVLSLYAITTAVLAGVLYGRLGGVGLTVPLLVAFGFGTASNGGAASFSGLVLLPGLLTAGGLLGAELRRLLLQREDALDLARRSLERAAVAEERARLSRELHDSVAKTVQGMALSAASVARLVDERPDLAAAQITAIREAAEQATSETRQLLSGLRMDDPSVGFAASVRDAVTHWSSAQAVAATVRAEVDHDPPLEVRYELFQILREALHNISKHADADHVEVAVTGDGDALELVVRDDGVGFEVPTELSELARDGHIGVVGFHERAATIGGQVTLRSEPGSGTQLLVRVPRRAAQEVAP